jgi:hypothetical protein
MLWFVRRWLPWKRNKYILIHTHKVDIVARCIALQYTGVYTRSTHMYVVCLYTTLEYTTGSRVPVVTCVHV